MSSETVEMIRLRLREEIDALGIGLAEAARRAGEKSDQRIKDVVSGKMKCPADLLAALMPLGFDVRYVLSGVRSSPARAEPTMDGLAEPTAPYAGPGLVINNKREIALIENYRACAEEGKDATERVALVAKKAQHPDVIAHTKRHANKGGS